MANTTETKPHTNDSDCTVDPASGCCTGCGVDHSGTCGTCGGRGFHIDGCAEMSIVAGDALDLIQQERGTFSLIVTDPPYAFGGSGDEHELSAVVAVTLREAAARLERGRWMVIMCAASWRSQCYMAEAVRGIVQPVRTATWCKPKARTKVVGAGWRWASVSVMAFRKGKAIDQSGIDALDHITAEPFVNGRRAELPAEVARWMVAPFAVAGGRFLDPFAGSGAIVREAAALGMDARGYEKHPTLRAAQVSP